MDPLLINSIKFSGQLAKRDLNSVLVQMIFNETTVAIRFENPGYPQQTLYFNLSDLPTLIRLLH